MVHFGAGWYVLLSVNLFRCQFFSFGRGRSILLLGSLCVLVCFGALWCWWVCFGAGCSFVVLVGLFEHWLVRFGVGCSVLVLVGMFCR